MNRIIVAGIHTEVGKTVVSTLLAQKLGAAYWKPVQCGTPADCEWVEAHSSVRCFPSAFSLETPCSPHLAAKREGRRIAAKEIEPPEHSGILIIEGTGGILAPLNDEESWADAAIHWGAEWILVYRPYLGSFNHFLLTVEVMRQRKIPLMGVVFNGKEEKMLLVRAKTRNLGEIAWEKQWTKERIQEVGLSGISL